MDEGTGAGEDGGERYLRNGIEGFQDGVILDLRVRIAVGLLTTSPIFHGLACTSPVAGAAWNQYPNAIAALALDISAEVLKQAKERGWVEPLDETGELSELERAQAKRTGSFSVLQQMEGQRFAQAEQGRVVPVAPIVRGNGRVN